MSFLHSIKFRFTVWYLLVLSILLIGLSIGVYFSVARSLRNNLDSSLELRASELQGIRGVLNSIRQGSFQSELGELIWLYVYNGDQLVRASSLNVEIAPDDEFVARAMEEPGSFATISSPEGHHIRLYARPFPAEPSPPPPPGMPRIFPGLAARQRALVVIGRSTEEIDNALSRLVRTLGIAAPLAMIVAGGGGVFLANRALRPVDRIARTARQIEESGNLDQRIQLNSRDELGRLAGVLNGMIERLQKAFRRQKEFTADASHELRAPLAVIQAESTLALQKERTAAEYQASLEMISQEASHMSALVDQLLALARADAQSEPVTFERFRLDELLDELALDAESLSREKGIIFRVEEIEELAIAGDRPKLKQLLLNLVDNAIRYTPAGGSVSLSLRREAETAVVAVSDTGIGIAAEHIPHIFERFYRVDKARSRAQGGSGLGLAIARQIAEAHGGRIEVESKVGVGSTFSVLLPLTRPD